MTAENTTSPTSKIDPIIEKTLNFFNQTVPDIKDRLELEREVKKVYKVEKPQDIVNLLLSVLAEAKNKDGE